jgi:hypothetical protein
MGRRRCALLCAAWRRQQRCTLCLSLQRIDESVIGPTKLLSLLNHANDAASPRRIHVSEFYNDAINQVCRSRPTTCGGSGTGCRSCRRRRRCIAVQTR